MQRIHFTNADLARTHLADGPHAMWELVMALHVLQADYGKIAFAEWRHLTRRGLQRHDMSATVRGLLFPVAPVASYFPDFLTPAEGSLGLEEGIDAILATPRQRIRTELELLHTRVDTSAPRLWRLADRDDDARIQLGGALRQFHGRAVAPHWPTIEAHIEADRGVRLAALRRGGVHELLDSFRPTIRWVPPVLEVDDNPPARERYLDGQGLLLVPSYFCWNHAVTIFDPALPPTLVYPLAHHRRWPAGAMANGRSLTPLLGRTRAAVLGAAAGGLTTGELAAHLDVSPTTVSDHTAVLREAGLITSHRHANMVTHLLTPLGAALLDGRLPDRRTED